MPIQFTIIDYTTNPAGSSNIVNEPVGWDNTTLRLKRDKDWHGFFDFFDDSYSGMKWHGFAASILQNAYATNGVEANCELLVTYACADTGEELQIYNGRFVFTRFSWVCGDMCYAECGVEDNSCLMAFKNRYNQKVNLDSPVAFDIPCTGSHTIQCKADFVDSINQIVIADITGYEYADITALKPGSVITITNTLYNNGTFTVHDVSIHDGFMYLRVNGPLVNETDIDFTIQGCLFAETLPAYPALNTTVVLPAKIVSLQNNWAISPSTYYYSDDYLYNQPGGQQASYYFPFEWDQERITEINDSDRTRQVFRELHSLPGMVFDNFLANTPAMLQLNLSETLRCAGALRLDINMHGLIEFTSHDSIGFTGSIVLAYGNPTDGFVSEILEGGFGCLGCNTASNSININTARSLQLKQKDRVYLYFIMAGMSYYTGPTGVNPFELTITISTATINFKIDTLCEDSPANVYLVNEALSRISESYTNGCLPVKSNYFGRTDSLPYASLTDGCGSLECITNGLKIRSKTNGVRIGSNFTEPPITLSMKELYDGLNAIHNLGMGIENDTVRGPGNNWLRIEPVEHFYNNTVLVQLQGVADAKTTVNTAAVYNTASIGYERWETESVNGLNDVFASRGYRTQVTQHQNEYKRLSNIMASDYAIEFTRRMYSSNTKDWRYDNSLFVICLTRQPNCPPFNGVVFTAPGTIVYPYIIPGLISGSSITVTGSLLNNGVYTVTSATYNSYYNTTTITVSGSISNENTCGQRFPYSWFVEVDLPFNYNNILFPKTCYNLRITPARNALRHLKTVFQGYSPNQVHQLVFTHGQGNYLAQLQLPADDCVWEPGMLAENQTLSNVTISNPALASPLYKPETVTFEYPITWQQYLTIKTNPYGLIGYQCGNGPMQYGWIENFELKPYTGMAKFTLKPKID